MSISNLLIRRFIISVGNELTNQLVFIHVVKQLTKSGELELVPKSNLLIRSVLIGVNK